MICFIYFSEIETCTPNPCQHGGICLTNEDRSYTCNCSGTMYSGENCDEGFIIISNYPRLFKDVQYMFSAEAKPDKDLVLSFFPDDRSSFIVNPQKLKFTQHLHINSFTIVAKKAGLFKLTYILSGSSSSKFIQPLPSNVIVIDNQTVASLSSMDFTSKGFQHGILQAGCCMPITSSLEYQCLSHPTNVKFTASCAWNEKGLYSTGIVFSSNNGFAFPIAISGVKFNFKFELSSLSVHELSDPCKPCIQGLGRVNEDIDVASEGECDTFKPSVNDILLLLNSETLAHTYFYHSHQLLPKWLRFNVTSADRTHDSNSYMVTLVESLNIEAIKMCHIVKTYSEGLYSVLIYSGILNISVNSETVSYHPELFPICFSINLCEASSSPVYISIPKDASKLIYNFGFMDIFYANNWNIALDSVTIVSSSMILEGDLAVHDTYWNGVENFAVDFDNSNLVVYGKIVYSFVNENFNIKYKFTGDVYLYTDGIEMVRHCIYNQCLKFPLFCYGMHFPFKSNSLIICLCTLSYW